MELSPYSWQTEALEAWANARFRGIVDVVTGAGKTFFAMLAITALKEFLDVPLTVFVVVPSCELQNQWRKKIEEFFPDYPKVGLIGAGQHDGIHHPFQIFVINSARNCLTEHRNRILACGEAVLLIADECHHYGAPENRKIFSSLPSGQQHYYTLGLSSTPQSFYFDSVLLPGLGPIVYRYRHGSAVKDHVIAPFVIQQISVSFNAEELDAYFVLSGQLNTLRIRLFRQHPELKDLRETEFFRALSEFADSGDETASAYKLKLFERKQLVLLAESRMQCAEQLVALLPKTSRIILFCERIQQADEIFRRLEKSFPHQLSKYHSRQYAEKNKEDLRMFRNGDTRILVSCKALDEGVDVPDADIAIVLSGSAQFRQRVQRLGRVLRRSPGKGLASLYYLYIHQSSEDSCFLPVLDSGISVTNYSFRPADCEFLCPKYENLSSELLELLKSRGGSTGQLREVCRCLSDGLLTTDWQQTPGYCQLCSENASELRERNYYLVMKWLCAMREKADFPADSIAPLEPLG